MNAVFKFIKKNAVLLVAIVFAIAVSVSVVSAKYVYNDTVADNLNLSITKNIEYTIDKNKLKDALVALSPKPQTLKFVKANEVPADAALMTAEGIQTTDSGTIGVYRDTDNTTVYIAPIGSNTAVMYAPENCYEFLNGAGNVTNLGGTLTTLDLKNLDTSRTANMSYMFSNLTYLTSIGLSSFNTANVTDMSFMFHSCQRLPSIDLSSFNTANVTNMMYMFYYARTLTTITVGIGFVTGAVTNSYYMFYCPNLTGGVGTRYSTSYHDKTYARIDGGTDAPGYFTAAA